MLENNFNLRGFLKSFFRYALIALYCFIGALGWYKYSVLYEKGNTVSVYDKLSPEMTVSYVRALVWYHSRGKLQELKFILMEAKGKDEGKIRLEITNMLKHRTTAYIRDFNSLDTKVKNLGNWYQDNFDFDNFLKDVFIIIFNDKYTIDEKIKYITDVMEEYQNMTTQKLILTLKENRN